MGADDQCVGRFLVSQALGTAAIGSTLGLLGSLGIGRGLSSPRSPVVLTWQVAVVERGDDRAELPVRRLLTLLAHPANRPGQRVAELRDHGLH